MKITEQRLKQIIREEYLGRTPTRRGEIMTEERANYLSNHLVNEVGIFSTLGAVLKGAFSGGATAAGGTLALPVKGVVRVGQAIAQAGREAADAIKGIKDATVKAYADKVKEALIAAIKAEITKSAGQLMKALVKTGKSEQEATAEASTIMTAAVSAATTEALKAAQVPGAVAPSGGGAAGDKGEAAAGGTQGGGAKPAQGGGTQGGAAAAPAAAGKKTRAPAKKAPAKKAPAPAKKAPAKGKKPAPVA